LTKAPEARTADLSSVRLCVSAAEILAGDHPMVRECAVLAVEGVDRLTTLKAYVVLDDGSSGSEETTRELQDYVKGRLLPYKYPRTVVYLNELPKTGTGKIDRQSLVKS